MTSQIKFWKVHKNETLEELPRAKLDLEERLEAWIESDISVLSEDLMIVGRQVETDYGGFMDLLCIDRNGDLVIVELKKDRTPRDVTAQAIDYASWVTDLSREDLSGIAYEYHKDSDMEAAFRDRFGDSLPEVINESHSMVVVGSNIDSSTERIIKYLSDEHGVKINAAEFEYFNDGDSDQEYLGRVFLIEPSDVEQKAERRGTSKRKPKLTFEELDELAEKHEVGPLYRQVVAALEIPLFKRTTQSSLAFYGKFETGRKVLFSLIPSDSSREAGLRFQVYLWRLAEFLSSSPDDVLRTLPDNSEDWAYESGEDKDWAGYTGFFQNEDDVAQFTSLFSEAIG